MCLCGRKKARPVFKSKIKNPFQIALEGVFYLT